MKKSKAQIRKEKKQAEFDAMRAEALEEAAQMPNHREIEDKNLESICTSLNLRIHSVPPTTQSDSC